MKNFNDIYENVYKKNYKVVEEKIKSKKIRMNIIFVLIVGISILLSNTAPKNGWLLIVLSIPVALICMVLFYNNSNNQLIIKDFIKEYDTNLKYRPNRMISSDLYAMGEFEKFDWCNTKDHIYGTLNNKIKIELCKILTDRRGSRIIRKN